MNVNPIVDGYLSVKTYAEYDNLISSENREGSQRVRDDDRDAIRKERSCDAIQHHNKPLS